MESDTLFTQLFLQRRFQSSKSLLQLPVSTSEVCTLVTYYFKGLSSSSNEATQGHKERVCVHAGQQVQVNTSGSEAFEDNAPAFFLSSAYFDAKRPETVDTRRPEWRLVQTQPGGWKVSHFRDDRVSMPFSAFQALTLMFTNCLSAFQYPVHPSQLCKDALWARMQ